MLDEDVLWRLIKKNQNKYIFKNLSFSGDLKQEVKYAHAWKDEPPGAKREILSLSCYYCYWKDLFLSKVA